MTVDPEVAYRQLVSGDAGAARSAAETLRGVRSVIAEAQSDIAVAARTPRWSGQAATAFGLRLATLQAGTGAQAAAVTQVQGALETAATSYDWLLGEADRLIGLWRGRPGGLPDAVEQVWAQLVNSLLVGVGRSYSQQLIGITAVLTGDDVDLDSLDAETRAWVEEGLRRNDDWRDGKGEGSSLGPLIPNTAATGDHRGFIPQGMDVGADGNYYQGYYTKEPKESFLAVIDPVSGQEVNEVQLGGSYLDEAGRPVEVGQPTHAGGVTIDRNDPDKAYVADNGTLYTYSVSDLNNAASRTEVHQSGPPQEIKGGSYTATDGTYLFSGDFANNKLYVYEQDSSGQWQQVGEPIETPDHAQGVVVRDDEFVFSTSHKRFNESSLIVQDKESGDRSEPYPLPNMSQSVVEVDGNLVTTYESGAQEFDHVEGGSLWERLTGKTDDLWANPFMTVTPLSELGLSADDVEVDPPSLVEGARVLEDPAAAMGTAAARLGSVSVSATSLGPMPAATALVREVNRLCEATTDSVRGGTRAIEAAVTMLEQSAKSYEGTDDGVRRRFGGR